MPEDGQRKILMQGIDKSRQTCLVDVGSIFGWCICACSLCAVWSRGAVLSVDPARASVDRSGAHDSDPRRPEKTRARPLSPHIRIYRAQITSVFSILHRLSGILLVLGAILFSIWLSVLVFFAEFFVVVSEFLAFWPVKVLLLGWIFALFYHLCNGLRHLLWDLRLTPKATSVSGYWLGFVFIGLRLGAGLGERADDILHGPERRSCDADPQLRRTRACGA